MSLSQFNHSYRNLSDPSIYALDNQFVEEQKDQLEYKEAQSILNKLFKRNPKLEIKNYKQFSALILEKLLDTSHLVIYNHPFYPDAILRSGGHSKNFVQDFNPLDVCTREKTPEEIGNCLKPLHMNNLKYHNCEQVFFRKCHMPEKGLENVSNLNADLGLQFTLSEVLRHSVITDADEEGLEQPSFVILSHGHSIAGLAALAKMTRTGKTGVKEALFDVTAYMPMGNWPKDALRLRVAGDRGQLWAEKIERSKQKHHEQNISYAQGVAIALNGHRCDLDGKPDLNKYTSFNLSSETKQNRAYIDVFKLLGAPADFKKELEDRQLKRVVIVNEIPAEDADSPNLYDIHMLRQSKVRNAPQLGAPPEIDLYEYMLELNNLGVEVLVASGEQRTVDAKIEQMRFESFIKKFDN